jgi:hypothetical protein
MVMMACSGYDPSCAVSLWHQFETIAKRKKLFGQFLSPLYDELNLRMAAFDAAKCSNSYAKAVTTLVAENKLQFYQQERRAYMAVLPGYVSSFPLKPSIHPYDGVFTGRITVRTSAPFACFSPSLFLFTRCR